MAIQIPRDLGFNPAGWQRAVDAIRQLVEGRHNAFGANNTELTLTPGAASTTVDHPNCGLDSVILLSPMTANAAAAIPTTYVSSVSLGSFTLAHANNAQIDRTFRFTVTGG
jgi:hypothetical protein